MFRLAYEKVLTAYLHMYVDASQDALSSTRDAFMMMEMYLSDS